MKKSNLFDRLHQRTLERIFIEERIYKKIEAMKTAEGVVNAVLKGFEAFTAELIREVTEEDVERLLRIPIRRISLYDINKNRAEVAEINARIKEINKLLKNLVSYAITVLNGILAKLDKSETIRRTEISRFTKVDVKEAVTRDTPLRYDEETGYLGTSVSSGTEILKVTPYDRILVLRRSGIYTIMDVPEKVFVDKGMWYCGFSDKEMLSKVLFTLVYKDGKTGYPCIKRCRIEGFILNRDYMIVPEDATVLFAGIKEKFAFTVKYKPKARLKTLEQTFKAQDYMEKGLKTLGVRLSPREVVSVLPEESVGGLRKAASKVVEKAVVVKDSPGKKPVKKTAPVSTATKPLSKATTGKTVTGKTKKASLTPEIKKTKK